MPNLLIPLVKCRSSKHAVVGFCSLAALMGRWWGWESCLRRTSLLIYRVDWLLPSISLVCAVLIRFFYTKETLKQSFKLCFPLASVWNNWFLIVFTETSEVSTFHQLFCKGWERERVVLKGCSWARKNKCQLNLDVTDTHNGRVPFLWYHPPSNQKTTK